MLRSRSPRPTFEMLRAISLLVQHQHLFYTFLTLYNSDIVFKNITGVLQGSILGPLLFIIYTSDLPLCLPLECTLFMYADDSTITCSSSNINEIENNLNTALGRIYDWCVRNKLAINANKTKSMLIGSMQKVCNTDLNVSIAGSSVVKVNYVKCLGVIIDES